MLPFSLPYELEERLNILAENTGKTKAFHIQEAITFYLDMLDNNTLKKNEDFINQHDTNVCLNKQNNETP